MIINIELVYLEIKFDQSSFCLGAIVEWWYTDPQKAINIKIYPIFPAIRPTVLRFMTSLPLALKKLNETDILDASVLLRHANVDDSGTYRCIIRPWSTDPLANLQEILFNDDSSISSLNYQVEITGLLSSCFLFH